MSLASLSSSATPYRSKMISFRGLNRTQELSSSTLSSSNSSSTETAQMIDGCNVTIDVNGNLVPRAQRLSTREYVNPNCGRIKAVAECMDYNNKRNAVMAIIGKRKDSYDKEDWFFFGENEAFSPYDIVNACGRYITDNQMIVVNTKLCFFPSNVYFDLINHVFRTLDYTVITTEGVPIKLVDEDTVINTTGLSVDDFKVDDVVDIYSGKNEYTHEDKGETYYDGWADFTKIANTTPTDTQSGADTSVEGGTTEGGETTETPTEPVIPPDPEYLKLNEKYGGNWYRETNYPNTVNITVAPTYSQIEAFKSYIYQGVSEFDEFRFEITGENIEATAVTRWYRSGKLMKQASVPFADFSSKYGIKAADASVSTFVFKAALFVSLKGRTSGSTSTIIKAIDKEKHTLTVEGTVYMVLFPDAGEVTDKTATGLTIVRDMPNIAYAVEWNNRVWGVSDVDNTIYASKLGDPTNWKYYQGTSMDSYYAEQASEGRWTGASKFGSHVLFFKERYIHRVYGSSPSSFQMSSIEAAGVKEGCYRSLATVNNILIYYSRNGFMGYYGENPEKISVPLGQINFEDVTAGYDGNKYYAHYKENGDAKTIAVFDTELGNWYLESCDSNQGVIFNFKGFLWHYDYKDGTHDSLQVINPYSNMTGALEDDVEWYAIFKFDELLDGQKVYSKFNARIQQYEGSRIEIAIALNSSDYESIREDDWMILADHVQEEDADKVYIEPIVPRRCNNIYIRIGGIGNAIVKSLTRSYRAAVERRN